MSGACPPGAFNTLPANYSPRRRSSTRRSDAFRRRSSSLTSHFDSDYHNHIRGRGQYLPAAVAPSSSHEDVRNDDECTKSFRPEQLLIGEMLGRGFFGEVYKVTEIETGEVYVMKRLIIKVTSDKKTEERFLKEVSTIRKFDHPNVLKFMGILYKEKQIHLITEYISGGTLKQFIENVEVDFPWYQRVGIAADVAGGMAYLHNKGIVHRDLNPGNILIREEDGSAVVADFGLVEWMTEKRHRRCTVVGSPYWMAPEMLREGEYDERVDVFSYGITLCEIIGRVTADPEHLPRKKDFGIDTKLFIEKFCAPCPRPFYLIAFRSASVDPLSRPPFTVILEWLQSLHRLVVSSPSVSPHCSPHSSVWSLMSATGAYKSCLGSTKICPSTTEHTHGSEPKKSSCSVHFAADLVSNGCGGGHSSAHLHTGAVAQTHGHARSASDIVMSSYGGEKSVSDDGSIFWRNSLNDPSNPGKSENASNFTSSVLPNNNPSRSTHSYLPTSCSPDDDSYQYSTFLSSSLKQCSYSELNNVNKYQTENGKYVVNNGTDECDSSAAIMNNGSSILLNPSLPTSSDHDSSCDTIYCSSTSVNDSSTICELYHESLNGSLTNDATSQSIHDDNSKQSVGSKNGVQQNSDLNNHGVVFNNEPSWVDHKPVQLSNGQCTVPSHLEIDTTPTATNFNIDQNTGENQCIVSPQASKSPNQLYKYSSDSYLISGKLHRNNDSISGALTNRDNHQFGGHRTEIPRCKLASNGNVQTNGTIFGLPPKFDTVSNRMDEEHRGGKQLSDSPTVSMDLHSGLIITDYAGNLTGCNYTPGTHSTVDDAFSTNDRSTTATASCSITTASPFSPRAVVACWPCYQSPLAAADDVKVRLFPSNKSRPREPNNDTRNPTINGGSIAGTSNTPVRHQKGDVKHAWQSRDIEEAPLQSMSSKLPFCYTTDTADPATGITSSLERRSRASSGPGPPRSCSLVPTCPACSMLPGYATPVSKPCTSRSSSNIGPENYCSSGRAHYRRHSYFPSKSPSRLGRCAYLGGSASYLGGSPVFFPTPYAIAPPPTFEAVLLKRIETWHQEATGLINNKSKLDDLNQGSENKDKSSVIRSTLTDTVDAGNKQVHGKSPTSVERTLPIANDCNNHSSSLEQNGSVNGYNKNNSDISADTGSKPVVPDSINNCSSNTHSNVLSYPSSLTLSKYSKSESRTIDKMHTNPPFLAKESSTLTNSQPFEAAVESLLVVSLNGTRASEISSTSNQQYEANVESINSPVNFAERQPDSAQLTTPTITGSCIDGSASLLMEIYSGSSRLSQCSNGLSGSVSPSNVTPSKYVSAFSTLPRHYSSASLGYNPRFKPRTTNLPLGTLVTKPKIDLNTLTSKSLVGTSSSRPKFRDTLPPPLIGNGFATISNRKVVHMPLPVLQPLMPPNVFQNHLISPNPQQKQKSYKTQQNQHYVCAADKSSLSNGSGHDCDNQWLFGYGSESEGSVFSGPTSAVGNESNGKSS